MRDMTEDLVGLVPPPEEPEPAGGSLPESVVLPEDYQPLGAPWSLQE